MATLTKKIGRYQITRELGHGAMGVVYHAIDPTIGRAVAVKTLRLHDVDDPQQQVRLRERLFREARSAGALSHPGIVTIYDMDEVDGLAYIAMEYVDGDTLEELLANPQGLSRERVTEVLNQAAAALDYAHRKGIVHRDIKPANIMIDTAGAVKITDFGIAKVVQMERQTLTYSMIGTPNYMSPEQVQGHETDGRSDQFSLCVIAYEMLTGKRPFFGEQISTVVYKIVGEPPIGVQHVNASLNAAVDKVLRRGLAKSPERRFPSCTAFTTALLNALNNAGDWQVLSRAAHQHLPSPAGGATAGTFRPLTKAAPVFRPATQSNDRNRFAWIFSFVLFILFLALLPWFLWPPHGARRFRNPFSAEQTHSRADANLPPPIGDPTAVFPEKPNGESSATVTKTSNLSEVQPPSRERGETVEREEPSTVQAIQVVTDPPEAQAALDDARAATCQTPCRFEAKTGIHNVTITKAGFQAESREIRVEHADVEFPLITLRVASGFLLLTSDPTGAQVVIDGKPTGWVTPVRVSLPTGSHAVSIQKDGLQSSGDVEIENGTLSALKLSVIQQ